VSDHRLYSYNFTQPCECGLTRTFREGVEVPHQHAEITPQMVRDAWAAGYDYAKQEETSPVRHT